MCVLQLFSALIALLP